MTREYDRGAALYAAFLEGDASALEALVQLYGDALTRFAYCIVRDDAAAEDVTADTFAALIVRRKKFREEAKFRTYLYAVARQVREWQEWKAQDSQRPKYTLTAGEGADLLLEPLPAEARAGTRVTFRTQIVMDADIVAYCNGEKLPSYTSVQEDGQYIAWEFAFIMPAQDCVIDLKVVGGM